MGWLVTGGIVFLLAILPLGVRIRYDADGPLVKLILGPVKMTVYPLPKKEKKENKPKEKMEPKEKKRDPHKTAQLSGQEKAKKETGGSLTDFLPLVKTALDLLGDLRRKLRVDDLYLRFILADSDPCDLAVNYGKTWAAVGNLMPVLERFLVIKKRDVEVACDFTASETRVIARVDITITLGRLFALAVVYGIRVLKEFMEIKNKRKGGAEK